MIKEAMSFIRHPGISELPATTRWDVLLMFINSIDNNGYVAEVSESMCKLLPADMVARDSRGWYFRSIRSAMSRRGKHSKYNRKRKNNKSLATKRSLATVVSDQVKVSSPTPPTSNGSLSLAKECPEENSSSKDSERTNADALFRDLVSIPDGIDTLKQISKVKTPQSLDHNQDSKGRAKAKKPRERDPIFDKLAEMTGSDPVVTGSHIAKVANLLKQAQPPYTVEELDRLPEALRKQAWFKDQRVTLGIVQNWIGLVRQVNSSQTEEVSTERPWLSEQELAQKIRKDRNDYYAEEARKCQERMELKRQAREKKRKGEEDAKNNLSEGVP